MLWALKGPALGRECPSPTGVAGVVHLGEAGRVGDEDVAVLREAADALIDGDSEPFVSLISDDMVWRGVRSWVPWRRSVPH